MRIVIDATRVRDASSPERDFFRDLVRNLLLRGGRHSFRIVGWPGRELGDLAAFLSPIPRNAPAWAVDPSRGGVADIPPGSVGFAPLGGFRPCRGDPPARLHPPSRGFHPLVTTVLGGDEGDGSDRSEGEPDREGSSLREAPFPPYASSGSHVPSGSHAIVLTRAARDVALRILGLPRPRVRWIPPPAGTCTSWDHADPAWGAEAGPYVATSVDGVSVEGFRSLLAAFRVFLRGTGSAARLLVLGKARHALRHAAWWSGVSARVRFVGDPPRGARSALLASAGAFVAATGRGRAWFATGEALAAGIPVICPSTGALPELVGDAGLYYDMRRPEDLSSQLWRCLEDEDLPRTLAQRSLRRAGALSWETFTLRVLDFLADVGQNRGDEREAKLESFSRV